jgi:hypothetical protein
MKSTFKLSAVAFGQLALSVEGALMVLTLSATSSLVGHCTPELDWLVSYISSVSEAKHMSCEAGV